MNTPPPDSHLQVMNAKKSHLGTKGRGRPASKAPADPQTWEAFQAAMAQSPFPSLRQWALAAEFDYQVFLDYARGKNLPPLNRAARIASIASTTMDALWGHLAEKKLPQHPKDD